MEVTSQIGLASEPITRGTSLAGSRWRSSLMELLLVGGLTPLLFPLSWLLRRHFGQGGPEYAVGFVFFYGAYVLNDPHFAVSYLLFYRGVRERAFGQAFVGAQRLRYRLVGFAAPLLLVVWASFGLARHSAASLGWLIQLMFLLVGWHYVKQGFGVLIVLSARRGVRWSPRERLVLLAHCYLGWAYAWASPADLGSEVEEKGVVYRTLAHGALLEQVTHGVFLATVLPLVWMLARKLRREGTQPIFTPLVGFLCAIWSWTIYSSIDPLVRYMTPALHSLQYLYFVWLLRGNEAREQEGPPSFGRARSVRLTLLALSAVALGVLLFHAGPSALDGALAPRRGPSWLGATPYFAALYACVNIHHYLMDFVLWRRENPETRYLTWDVASRASS